jgi:hypothetical protein
MLILIIIALISFFTVANNRNFETPHIIQSPGECAVAEIYEAIEPDSPTKALTRSGDLEEIELILVKTTIDVGNYSVTASRKAKDLYKIDGTTYFVETRYCYEYQYYASAVLKVESNYGFNKGKIIF